MYMQNSRPAPPCGPPLREEPDGLKLRIVRAVQAADVTAMAGMVKAPSRGVPRKLEDFDPASLVARGGRGRR